MPTWVGKFSGTTSDIVRSEFLWIVQMPKLWVVISLSLAFAWPVSVLAYGREQRCEVVSADKRGRMEKDILSFFNAQVGIRVEGVALVEIKECPDRYYASVEGVTKSGASRLWFVEIFKGKGGRKVLHRPE